MELNSPTMDYICLPFPLEVGVPVFGMTLGVIVKRQHIVILEILKQVIFLTVRLNILSLLFQKAFSDICTVWQSYVPGCYSYQMLEALKDGTVPSLLIVVVLLYQSLWVNSLIISQVSILTIPYFPQKVGPKPF